MSNLEVHKCVLGLNGNDTLSKITKTMQTRMVSFAGIVEETSRRKTEDVSAWYKECYDCLEQSVIVKFTWLGFKSFPN